MSGLFITIEGIECVGKSTNAKFISQYLQKKKIKSHITREPGGTKVGEKIRNILLFENQESISPTAELMLLFAARDSHINDVIKPKLSQGTWVICDRFTDASFAYQGYGRELGFDAVNSIKEMVMKDFEPTLTLLLDAPLNVVKSRRKLNPDEIYDQVVAMDQQSKLYHQRPLSNIVFMGMGEPLMNYNNVLAAIEKITDTEALGMSPRRITLSTSGIPKLIRKMADDKVKFGLAVSLHSARQEVRERIMPFAKKFPLTELIESLEYWYAYTKKQITFEYVVWEGVNDLKEDIQALVGLCRRIPSKVNIIQYNPIDGSSMKQGNQTVIDAYIAALTKARISVTYRRSRGVDIDAACGQLANKIDVK